MSFAPFSPDAGQTFGPPQVLDLTAAAGFEVIDVNPAAVAVELVIRGASGPQDLEVEAIAGGVSLGTFTESQPTDGRLDLLASRPITDLRITVGPGSAEVVSVAGSVAVPEPAGFGLALVGLAVCLLCSRNWVRSAKPR